MKTRYRQTGDFGENLYGAKRVTRLLKDELQVMRVSLSNEITPLDGGRVEKERSVALESRTLPRSCFCSWPTNDKTVCRYSFADNRGLHVTTAE